MKIRFGAKILMLKKAAPHFRGWRLERGPFRCWNLYFWRFRIGWELARWH